MISVPKKRVKQLTRDTALAVHQMCNGLVDLTRHLLSTTHSYVVLGKYTTDKLEKSFSKLRQGSGGTYFMSVQQILEKIISRRHYLQDNSCHSCSLCMFEMDEEAA